MTSQSEDQHRRAPATGERKTRHGRGRPDTWLSRLTSITKTMKPVYALSTGTAAVYLLSAEMLATREQPLPRFAIAAKRLSSPPTSVLYYLQGRELRIAQELSQHNPRGHQHFLHVAGVASSPGVHWLLMERASGTLRDASAALAFAKPSKREKLAKWAIKDTLGALQHLHGLGLLWNDAKIENIFLRKDRTKRSRDRFVIGDWGNVLRGTKIPHPMLEYLVKRDMAEQEKPRATPKKDTQPAKAPAAAAAPPPSERAVGAQEDERDEGQSSEHPSSQSSTASSTIPSSTVSALSASTASSGSTSSSFGAACPSSSSPPPLPDERSPVADGKEAKPAAEPQEEEQQQQQGGDQEQKQTEEGATSGEAAPGSPGEEPPMLPPQPATDAQGAEGELPTHPPTPPAKLLEADEVVEAEEVDERLARVEETPVTRAVKRPKNGNEALLSLQLHKELRCGTRGHRAPEVLLDRSVGDDWPKVRQLLKLPDRCIDVYELLPDLTPAVDVFAVGVALFHTVARTLPFGAYRTADELLAAREDEELKARIASFKKSVSAECFDLFERMTHPNPQERITVQEALRHPFFQQDPAAVHAHAHAQAKRDAYYRQQAHRHAWMSSNMAASRAHAHRQAPASGHPISAHGPFVSHGHAPPPPHHVGVDGAPYHAGAPPASAYAQHPHAHGVPHGHRGGHGYDGYPVSGYAYEDAWRGGSSGGGAPPEAWAPPPRSRGGW